MRTPSFKTVDRCLRKDSSQQPTRSRASRKSQDLIAVAAERDMPHAFDSPPTAVLLFECSLPVPSPFSDCPAKVVAVNTR